jgi:hypothetical protein
VRTGSAEIYQTATATAEEARKGSRCAVKRTTLQGNRPPGRPPKHYVRWLSRQLKEAGFDGRTQQAKALQSIANDLADDAGGWANLTSREIMLVRRTAALLLLCETIEHHVFSQQNPFTETGELLNVLAKNYIAYSNTLRLNLLALGLKPPRPDAMPSLQDYIASQAGGGNGTPGSAGGSQSDDRTAAKPTDEASEARMSQ